MAITQTRTTARKKMVSNTRGVSDFAWVNSAQARKIGLVVDNGKYFLGDLRLTPANVGVILTQLKTLGRMIGKSAVH